MRGSRESGTDGFKSLPAAWLEFPPPRYRRPPICIPHSPDRDTLSRLASGLEVQAGPAGPIYSLEARPQEAAAPLGSPSLGTTAGGPEEAGGLTLEQLCWLEASLWRLCSTQLDLFGADHDPEALAEAVEVAEAGEGARRGRRRGQSPVRGAREGDGGGWTSS